ncbi:SAM-dependent DNA methyltransferase [Pseudomaricurvus alcaniphilus]|uniref:HsdM family class I SAM-dependent methyltransferase n=1 Tax=Pseudomaricurvus alcaniphilus TaxID=1166482 RepID=UPI001409BF15|nr:class I SAM-dependent DNA methyltransferase [Pseudomaricurvus alcaniphilus]NHN36903.1 SAM-dependent DNA methyltransferase [Pseudomaricurvus alcaniphilus]
MSVSTVIKSIQDIMRKDAGVDGDAQRLGQLSWLLFLKIFDAQEEQLEFEQDNYRAPIPSQYLWRNWAADDEGITGDSLLEFINNDLFPALKGLTAPIDKNPRGFVVKEAFSDAFNYMKNGTLLRQVINKLNEIDFTDSSERHLFGDIYEQILKDLQSAGNAGEFYTPRAVTRFIVQMIDPQLGETVFDPACGTGGFLACAFDHIGGKYVKTATDHQTLQGQIRGVEKKQLPHLLCTTNMLLHGIEIPVQIQHDNTLSKPLSSWESDVDVIVTNPPFGGTEEDGIEKNFPSELQTRETADLFLQLIVEVLKPGGRAAVVLPDGTLFGEGVKTKLKKMLLEECNLHTIVRLPNSVFAPYTSIKTNILFFEKSKAANKGTKEIWYYEVPLPDGVKAFNKTKPMKLEHFDDCADWWGEGKSQKSKLKRKDRQENQFAWKVSIDDIVARNYNLDIKNPHVEEQISHDPDVLLADYSRQQNEIQQLRDQLKGILAEAMTSKDVGVAQGEIRKVKAASRKGGNP